MHWTPKSPDLSSIDRNLLSNICVQDVKRCTAHEIVIISDKFPIKFPVNTGRLKTLQDKVSEECLDKYINSVYPFVHENVLKLYAKFLDLKRIHGSPIERDFYKDMGLKDFVDRLLQQRAVMFMGKDDKYLLLSGKKGSKNWEIIGTDKEKPPLLLRNCLSYDEVKLSAFLYVSSYTYFVNKGDRKNKGVYCEDRSNIQPEGVIAGMIGPRLKKSGVMDFQEIVATAQQNNKANGYAGRRSVHHLFAEFYDEESSPLYEEVVRRKASQGNRYVDIKAPKGAIFDNQLYRKRLTIVFDSLLIEANSRAQEARLQAYVHVVGLGLGVWRISDHQEGVFMECFYDRIVTLCAKLPSISDICFSYINQESCEGYKTGDRIPIKGHPLGGIKVHIVNRQPHEKLDDPGKLLVVSYAWDGNALPGNEFWTGKLASSGDSAAASSTQIAELHNVHINPAVCANNLRVATARGELVHLRQYLERTIYLKRNRITDDIGDIGESSKKSKTND